MDFLGNLREKNFDFACGFSKNFKFNIESRTRGFYRCLTIIENVSKSLSMTRISQKLSWRNFPTLSKARKPQKILGILGLIQFQFSLIQLKQHSAKILIKLFRGNYQNKPLVGERIWIKFVPRKNCMIEEFYLAIKVKRKFCVVIETEVSFVRVQ